MKFLQKKIMAMLLDWRASGLLKVIYTLATEALLIGYVYFIGFFTIETLLPTFVTVRFSLTTFFFFLIIATMLLSLLGRLLALSFSWNINKKSPLLWLGLLWALGIATISLIKFPLVLLLIIIALFFLSGYLFWNIFFEKK